VWSWRRAAPWLADSQRRLTRTFDVCFDNIFSDWSVRSRITEAAKRAESAAAACPEVRTLRLLGSTVLLAGTARNFVRPQLAVCPYRALCWFISAFGR
jgi:hypothetical protein